MKKKMMMMITRIAHSLQLDMTRTIFLFLLTDKRQQYDDRLQYFYFLCPLEEANTKQSNKEARNDRSYRSNRSQLASQLPVRGAVATCSYEYDTVSKIFCSVSGFVWQSSETINTGTHANSEIFSGLAGALLDSSIMVGQMRKNRFEKILFSTAVLASQLDQYCIRDFPTDIFFCLAFFTDPSHLCRCYYKYNTRNYLLYHHQ